MKYFSIIPLIFFLFASCQKDSEKGQPEVPYFFEISFHAPDTIKIREGKEGYQNTYGSGSFSGTGGIHVERQSSTFQGGKFKVSVYFIKTFTGTPNGTEIENMFFEGNHAFGKSYVSPFIDGAEIMWKDSLDVEWWTSKGSQNGSSFTVTKQAANSYDSFSPFITSGQFECNFFNDAGDSIRASGRFLGRTVDY